MSCSRRFAVALVCLLFPVLFSCGSGDPRQSVLKERARWTVQALDWLQTEDGEVRVGTRVSGPPNSKLETLTVRFLLRDGSGELVTDHWHSYDLTQVPRGGPKDVSVFIPTSGQEVAELGMDMMLAPDAEQEGRIRELQP